MSKHEDVPTDVYEVGFHVVSSVPEEEVGARVAAVHDVIEKYGGVIISEEFPKSMELAYPMVKVANNQRKTYTNAYFGWVKFEGPTSSPAEVKKTLDADEKILRFIIIKTVKENTLMPKKLIAQAGKQDERDERPARKEEKEKPVMTDAELDKTIDVLAGTAPAETKV
jgi:ribosomal protein S6